MSGSCREGLRSRGRNVKADTTTSLLPGGGAGLLVARGGGETDLIHQRHVPQSLVQEEFVHLAREPGVEVAEAFLEPLQPRGSVVGLRTASGGEEEQAEDEEAVHPTAQAASRPSRPLW